MDKDSKAIEALYFSRKVRSQSLEAGTIYNSIIDIANWYKCSNISNVKCFSMKMFLYMKYRIQQLML